MCSLNHNKHLYLRLDHMEDRAKVSHLRDSIAVVGKSRVKLAREKGRQRVSLRHWLVFRTEKIEASKMYEDNVMQKVLKKFGDLYSDY